MTDPKSLDLAALQTREAVATPGPWYTEEEMVQTNWIDPLWPEDDQAGWTVAECYNLGGKEGHGKANAAFIAHAREDIPALRAALEQAQQDNERVTRDRDAKSHVIDRIVDAFQTGKEPDAEHWPFPAQVAALVRERDDLRVKWNEACDELRDLLLNVGMANARRDHIAALLVRKNP
jgi:hypothetical protein